MCIAWPTELYNIIRPLRANRSNDCAIDFSQLSLIIRVSKTELFSYVHANCINYEARKKGSGNANYDRSPGIRYLVWNASLSLWLPRALMNWSNIVCVIRVVRLTNVSVACVWLHPAVALGPSTVLLMSCERVFLHKNKQCNRSSKRPITFFLN